MKILRIAILGLLIWNLPSIALTTLGSTISSLLSHVLIVLLALYYLLENKSSPNWWIIIMALLYFTISSFQYYDESKAFLNGVFKFFIFVLGGYALVKKVNKEQLFLFVLLGSLSIAVDALLFPTDRGRYGGFYLNPNTAGFICIYGYALTYGLRSLPLKLLGQFVFTLMGLLTFSRTFIVIWILLNLISLKISIKNIRIIGVGFLIFSSLLVIDDLVGLNNPRFDQLKNILNNEQVSSEELNEDSRTETWALYYDKIIQSPFIGNGFGSFAGEANQRVGVHNTYLRIIGEAGIIPFLLLIAYIMHLIYWSIYFFKEQPYLLMQSIALALFLMSNHNFFVFYYVMFAAMWIQYQIVKQKETPYNNENELENNKLET